MPADRGAGDTGLFYHVAFALGLAFGSRHQYAFALDYLYHPR